MSPRAPYSTDDEDLFDADLADLAEAIIELRARVAAIERQDQPAKPDASPP